MNSRIAESAGRISLATAASRILGFVRDLLIAKLFGTGIQAEAFVVAFRLPNLFRDLVAEGAVTTAVVPVLSSYRATKSPEEFWRLAQATCVKVLLAGTLSNATTRSTDNTVVRNAEKSLTAARSDSIGRLACAEAVANSDSGSCTSRLAKYSDATAPAPTSHPSEAITVSNSTLT